jgi:hypothetical protein
MMKNAIGAALVVTSMSVMIARAGVTPVAAQPTASPIADKTAIVLIPGRMTGPGTMGPRGYKRLCTPRSIGLYEWQMRWVERLLRPADTQRAALNDLQAASAKALTTISAACKAEIPTTTSAELQMIDNRLDAVSRAVKTLRPAFDAFYTSLDDQQKHRLDIFGPKHQGWRW